MNIKVEIPRALRAAYMALHRRTDAQLAPHGVTADQFVLLANLGRGNALTQRELASRMPSDPSTVRAMLVILERRGLVSRDAHPTDSRARTAALTAKGKRKLEELLEAGESIRQQMFDALLPGEPEALVGFLKSVAEALNTESALVNGTNSNHSKG
jgi:DNA-binding MarR family transcriptional regulator